ncbi:hypothetical protein ABPG72_004623 [Tetrahymena utriculariae]
MNNQQRISDQTKESVQNTIRNLQQRTEHIEKLIEKGNDVLVFQIGSHNIKYGFASQENPNKIRTLVAYKTKNNESSFTHESFRSYDAFDKEVNKLEQLLKGQKKIGTQTKGPKGGQNSVAAQKLKQRVEISLKTLEFQNKMEIEENAENDITKRIMLFGEEVFMVEQHDNFMIRKPIKHGYLNVGEYNGDFHGPINDIQNIIEYILIKKLSLTRKQFPQYKIVLCIPDVFQRQQIKLLVNMFLLSLNFNAIYMHQESILACFGYCIGQACVVDIGAEKINVCCVDEGLIIPNTLMRKNYGGDDIDVSLMRMLNKRGCIAFKQKTNYRVECRNYGDMHQIEKLKEKHASFEQAEDLSNRVFEMHCVRNGIEELFTVQYNEALYISPTIIFHADILNALTKNTSNSYKDIDFEFYDYRSKKFEYNEDPEDNLEEVTAGIVWGQQKNLINPYLAGAHIIEQRKKDELKKELLAQNPNLNQQQNQNPEQIEEQKKQELQQQQTYKLTEDELLNPYTMVNLEDIISQSIANVKDPELRKKLANHILIIGGTSQTSKMVEELEDRLIEKISQYDYNIERVEVIDSLSKKEMYPSYLSWIGATVIPRLDSIKDLWINQNRWLGLFDDIDDSSDDEVSNTEAMRKEERKDKSNEYGIKYLKEKVPFQW